MIRLDDDLPTPGETKHRDHMEKKPRILMYDVKGGKGGERVDERGRESAQSAN